MITINIDKNSKFENIETYLVQLERAKEIGMPASLMLPKSLKYTYFGLIPSLIQFVITWMRYEYADKLVIDTEDFSEEGLFELYKNELIFPVVVLAWNKTGVFDRKGISLRKHLQPINKLYSERMLNGRTLPGNKLFLTDFDHLPDDRLLPCFGNKYKFVQTKSELKKSIDKGIREVFYMYTELPRAFDHSEDPFISIIYELMKNTFEWARHDERLVPIDPNIRGTLLKFIRKKRKSLLDEYKWHKGLKGFFASERLKENSLNELYLMEISVFDGGVGFANKFRATNKNVENWNEIDIIKKCLTKHATSAKGIDKDEKGLGLDQILQILDGRGLIRIKTGHSCVYRNMITHPYDNPENNQIVLYDWKSHKEQKFTKYQNIQGAVITIIYAIGFTNF